MHRVRTVFTKLLTHRTLIHAVSADFNGNCRVNQTEVVAMSN